MNKKAQASVVLIGIFMVSSLSIAFYKTKEDGTLQKNGKKIWCKMQNKGEAYCNAL